MLRGFVLGLGLLMTAGGALAIALSQSGVGLYFLVMGPVLTVGTIFERVFYKPVTTGRPGPGWTDTGERTVDPETGQTVAVYYNASSGERRYVEGGSPH